METYCRYGWRLIADRYAAIRRYEVNIVDSAYRIIQEVISNIFAIDRADIKPNSDLAADFGMDSLDVMELVMRLETRLNIQVEEDHLDQFNDFRTVGDLASLIRSLDLSDSLLTKTASQVDMTEALEYDEQYHLTRYVWNFYGHLATDSERRVNAFILALSKAKGITDKILEQGYDADDPFVMDVRKRGEFPPEKDLIEALAKGPNAFRNDVRARLLVEYGDDIFINRCSSCHRVVSTPEAKQCLWCGHDWHSRGADDE